MINYLSNDKYIVTCTLVRCLDILSLANSINDIIQKTINMIKCDVLYKYGRVSRSLFIPNYMLASSDAGHLVELFTSFSSCADGQWILPVLLVDEHVMKFNHDLFICVCFCDTFFFIALWMSVEDCDFSFDCLHSSLDDDVLRH